MLCAGVIGCWVPGDEILASLLQRFTVYGFDDLKVRWYNSAFRRSMFQNTLRNMLTVLEFMTLFGDNTHLQIFTLYVHFLFNKYPPSRLMYIHGFITFLRIPLKTHGGPPPKYYTKKICIYASVGVSYVVKCDEAAEGLDERALSLQHQYSRFPGLFCPAHNGLARI
ncbi:hypothetical protein CBL_12727 [Carabus blaptoides fortunei]